MNNTLLLIGCRHGEKEEESIERELTTFDRFVSAFHAQSISDQLRGDFG